MNIKKKEERKCIIKHRSGGGTLVVNILLHTGIAMMKKEKKPFASHDLTVVKFLLHFS